MIKLKAAAIFSIVVILFLGTALAGEAVRAPDAKMVYKTLPDGRTLSFWFYWPAGYSPTDQRSAVLLFHGGSWRAGSPALMKRQAIHFAALGMVGISAEYRLAAKGVGLIESTKDARSAMRWIKVNAVKLGIDPAHIVAGGGSAGGHLAATLATTDRVNEVGDNLAIDPTPFAMLLFNPALNFKYPGFLRGRIAKIPAANGQSLDDLLIADPIANMKAKFPSCMIFHGTADKVVPFGAVEEFVKATKGACRLVAYEGSGHGFFNSRSSSDFDDVMRRSDEFLKTQGLIPNHR